MTGEPPGERVEHELVSEFGTRLDPREIRREVHRAVRELEGQTPPGGALELIHRLARTRILGGLATSACDADTPKVDP